MMNSLPNGPNTPWFAHPHLPLTSWKFRWFDERSRCLPLHAQSSFLRLRLLEDQPNLFVSRAHQRIEGSVLVQIHIQETFWCGPCQ